MPEIAAEIPTTRKADAGASHLVGAVKKGDHTSAKASGAAKSSPSTAQRGNAPSGGSAKTAAAPAAAPAVPVVTEIAVNPARAKKPNSLKEGMVAKATDKKHKTWDTRWLVLLPDALVLYRDDRTKELERINLAHVVSAAVDSTTPKQFGTVFVLSKLDGQSVAFRAAGDGESQGWVDEISANLTPIRAKGVPPKNTPAAAKAVADAVPAFVEPSPSYSTVPSMIDAEDDAQRLYNPFAAYPAFVPPYAMYAALENQPQSSSLAAPPTGYAGGVGSTGFNSAFYPAPAVPAMQGAPLGTSLYSPLEQHNGGQQFYGFPPAGGLWGPDAFASMMQMQQHLPPPQHQYAPPQRTAAAPTQNHTQQSQSQYNPLFPNGHTM